MVVAQEKMELELERPMPRNPRTQKRPARHPRQKGNAKGILMVILMAGVMGAVGVASVQITVVQDDQVKALQKEVSDLKQGNDLLQVQADKLRSVSRIEQEALAMGMEKPSGTVYVAGNLNPVQSETGDTQSKAAAQPAEKKPSALQQIAQLFTNFFALVQK